jgi:hypothetical protein
MFGYRDFCFSQGLITLSLTGIPAPIDKNKGQYNNQV